MFCITSHFINERCRNEPLSQCLYLTSFCSLFTGLCFGESFICFIEYVLAKGLGNWKLQHPLFDDENGGCLKTSSICMVSDIILVGFDRVLGALIFMTLLFSMLAKRRL